MSREEHSMGDQAPKRRRLQFGLATLLAVVLLAALFLGYTAWWMQRLREVERRNEALVKEVQAQKQRDEDARLLQRLEELRLQEATPGLQRPTPHEGGSQ